MAVLQASIHTADAAKEKALPFVTLIVLRRKYERPFFFTMPIA